MQARDELEARAASLESELLEARERHIHEAEAHSVQVAKLESELKEAQDELAKWMQQQQASRREQADLEALQQECQQLQGRLQDAEATSQVLDLSHVLRCDECAHQSCHAAHKHLSGKPLMAGWLFRRHRQAPGEVSMLTGA